MAFSRSSVAARPSVSMSLIATLAHERASSIASAPIPALLRSLRQLIRQSPFHSRLPCVPSRELIVVHKTAAIAIVPVVRW